MSEQALSDELQKILAVLKEHPAGLRIGELVVLLPSVLSKRTLLRRLSILQEQGDVFSKGGGSGTRYFVQPSESLLPLSKSAKLLKAQVEKPIQQRKPMAYQPDFLYGYQPNSHYYLTKSVRDHLHQIGQPFKKALAPGTYAKRILHRLLIDLSWNSSRLEGNTYSLLETERLIEYGARAKGKAAFEAQMIVNHKEAIEFMVGQISQDDINQHIILNIHALLSNNLLKSPKARGRLRDIPVGIGQAVYYPPELPALIAEYFAYMLASAGKIADPFEQAFFLMVQLPYLQPFEDVNKRVSRLAANIPLIKHNLSPLSFIDVPKDDYISGLLAIYELNKVELLRDVFVWAYERSTQQYQLMQETLTEPNLTYMRFKKELFVLINLVVSDDIRGEKIIEAINDWAFNHIDEAYRTEFIRIAQREIASLHAGNIAIYQIKPEVFSKWRLK